jgi:hypothetical protein
LAAFLATFFTVFLAFFAGALLPFFFVAMTAPVL